MIRFGNRFCIFCTYRLIWSALKLSSLNNIFFAITSFTSACLLLKLATYFISVDKSFFSLVVFFLRRSRRVCAQECKCEKHLLRNVGVCGRAFPSLFSPSPLSSFLLGQKFSSVKPNGNACYAGYCPANSLQGQPWIRYYFECKKGFLA